jgi:hypothetical protein
MPSTSRTVLLSPCIPAKNEVNRTTCWGVKRPVHLRRRVQMKKQPVHMFLNTETNNKLMSRCSNVAQFTLKYNEEHILMPNSLPSVHHAIVDSDALLKIDTSLPALQLVFLVRLILKTVEITVYPDTSLDTLLTMECIHVEQIMLTSSQMVKLL